MRSTYINDNNLSSFPFDAYAELPFPPGIVYGLSVAVRCSSSVLGIYASSVELGYERLSISLNATVPGAESTVTSVYLGTITAAYGAYGTLSSDSVAIGDTGSISFNAIMCAGLYDSASVGTYKGNFKIDPQCLVVMPDDVFGSLYRIAVNGAYMTIGGNLSISTGGLVSADVVSSGDSTAVTIKCGSTDTNEMFSMDNGNSYSFVTGINGVDVASDTSTERTLAICISAPAAAPTADKYSYIAYNTDITDETVVISIRGTHKIPNCYDDTDEA